MNQVIYVDVIVIQIEYEGADLLIQQIRFSFIAPSLVAILIFNWIECFNSSKYIHFS